jgi:hypothetical protein
MLTGHANLTSRASGPTLASFLSFLFGMTDARLRRGIRHLADHHIAAARCL